METLSNTLIGTAKRIVIKIGSALLVDAESGDLRRDWLAGLASDVAMLRDMGAAVVIVSSGSIALGRSVLGLESGPLPLERAQAAAAVGQIRLARAYQEVLAPHNIEAAQILVTLEDSEDRRRYLNSRATFETLLDLGVVPIVNETTPWPRTKSAMATTTGWRRRWPAWRGPMCWFCSRMWTGFIPPTRARTAMRNGWIWSARSPPR